MVLPKLCQSIFNILVLSARDLVPRTQLILVIDKIAARLLGAMRNSTQGHAPKKERSIALERQ